MNKKIKIVYCLPSLYIPGGMERVLTIKANYFAEKLGYDIYIILTDGKGLEPFYALSPKVHLIHLDINFNAMDQTSVQEVIHLCLQTAFIQKTPHEVFV